LAADVGGCPMAQVQLEGGGDVGHVSPVDHHPGDVGPPDRAVSGTSQHFFHRDVDAQLGEALEDGVVALLPAPAQVRQTVLERSGLVVDPQDDHVHAAAPVGVGDHAGPVEGQLDAGDQLDV